MSDLKIVQMLVPSSKYYIKCPYPMKPVGICIHNTANRASARAEISYMIGNNSYTSYHFAVDDKEAVQGLPLNRNGWHAGDGQGPGNRSYIGVEICYSLDPGDPRYIKAENNAAILSAMLMKTYGWGTGQADIHRTFSGKYCPHRMLDNGGWPGPFKAKVQRELDLLGGKTQPNPVTPAIPSAKTGTLYRVQVGAFSDKKNAEKLKADLIKAGFKGAFITKQGALYKVQVGAYQVKANAENQARIVRAKGFKTYIAEEKAPEPPHVSRKGTWRVDRDCYVYPAPKLATVAVAMYRNGQRVNIDSTVRRDGRVWGHYISYSGIHRYLDMGPSGNWGRWL